MRTFLLFSLFVGTGLIFSLPSGTAPGSAVPVSAQVESESGKPFGAWDAEEYLGFLKGLDLARADDLARWSQVTGVPVVALRQPSSFFRGNAHLIANVAAARKISAEDLKGIQTTYDRKTRELQVRDVNEQPLPLRADASAFIRELKHTAQILRYEDHAEDRTDLQALGPYLARLEEVAYLQEIEQAIRSLPLSIVRVLRGKALYLSTQRGDGSGAIWWYVGNDRSPEYAGMQPGVFIERGADGENADALVRGIGRIVRETVLEGRYFGLYAHPLQFPEFQKLDAERRRVFGKRRDLLPQTAYGYITPAAREEPTENFVEHFLAYLTRPEQFRARASAEQTQGHPELMEKLLFMERLAERTPTTAEHLSPEHIAHVDELLQRKILEEYLARQAERDPVVARVRQEFGKPFSEFNGADYGRFMASLDLARDEDLWKWSHVTAIPVVGLSQRSNFFHKNVHLLKDVRAAQLMPWSELTRLRSKYDPQTDRIQMHSAAGVPLPIRELPERTILQTEESGRSIHNKGFVDDRIVFEALEPALLRLADLENREELNEGIRLLPLSIVKAHRGKALYPTNRSKTGWAVTWRVNTDRNVSYVGMISGSFIEPRRDPKRAAVPAEALVDRGIGSLRGSSTDSLLHEVGHIISSSVIGGRDKEFSFPNQFPEFRKLLEEAHRVFGDSDDDVPQTPYGYISAYAKANAQESFAEHFWAFVRDREGFLARAREEESEGHPELMDKYLFMERLVERTPATMQRLSPEYLAALEAKEEERDDGKARRVLWEYRFRLAEKDVVIAAVESRLGKKFSELTDAEYARFMSGLDLHQDDDLWKWSHVTGIPIFGVNQTSSFFYANAHLIEDRQAAVAIPLRDLTRLKSAYDPAGDRLTLSTADGQALRLREIPVGTIRRSARTGGLSYDEGYAEPRTLLEIIAPYLVALGEIQNRPAISEALQALPLSAVKAYRGKAVYFTTHAGRSYAVGMPISNSIYKGFAGMQAGVFVDNNNSKLTTHNLVHEMGHIIDYTVISGRYGTYLHPFQFPEFLELRRDKERIFGSKSDKVPQTGHGYVSRYAKANAQESFAEHFAYFILKRERFLELAQEEQSAGHPELMSKYRFLEKMLERTPVTMRRLSKAFVERLVEAEGKR